MQKGPGFTLISNAEGVENSRLQVVDFLVRVRTRIFAGLDAEQRQRSLKAHAVPLSMNTLSDDGGWIGDDLLAELASQSVQDAVLGFQYPRLVLSHTSLDEVEAFDHHAPEECG